MYDLDDDDSISRIELLAVLHMMVGSNISEDQVLLLHQTHDIILFVNITVNKKMADLVCSPPCTFKTVFIHE